MGSPLNAVTGLICVLRCACGLAPALPAGRNREACFGRRTCPWPPAGPAPASGRPQASPGGLAFYDLPLTSRVSPLQLRASQWYPSAFSIANVSALEEDAGTTRATKGLGENGLARSQETDPGHSGFGSPGCGARRQETRRGSLQLPPCPAAPRPAEGKALAQAGVMVQEGAEIDLMNNLKMWPEGGGLPGMISV